ncbi:MAG: ABC transporter permease [Alphaproteobacteria bacterium]
MFDRLTLTARQRISPLRQGAVLAAGILLGLAIAAAVLALNGVGPSAIVDEFVLYVFTTESGLAQALTRAVALCLVGLGAVFALKLRFWNIGVDGQAWVGAIAASWIAIDDIGPPGIRLALMLAAGALAGALWIGLPALLKLRLGVSEVVSTLMLTYVAFQAAEQLLYGPWRDPDTGFPVSPAFDEGIERLGQVGLGHLHAGVWIALAAAVAAVALLQGSRFGFYAAAVGHNPRAARAAGMPLTWTLAIGVGCSGLLAGLAGATVVAGQEYHLTRYIAGDFTFSAILIALLARLSPLAVLPVGLVLAGIYVSGDALKAFYQLPLAVIQVIEAVILLSVVLLDFFARYQLHLAPRPAAAAFAAPATPAASSPATAED